jgi:hypothetical protein
VGDGCGFNLASERRDTCACVKKNKYNTNAFQTVKRKIYMLASKSTGVRCDE